jgi:hypothetical protein
MLRLARWHCRVADDRVGQCQIVDRLSHGPCPSVLCPRGNDRTGKNRVSDLPSTVCPKGKFAGGTTGAHKMCYGPPWSTMVTHYKNTIINRPLCKFTMVRAGWLGSTDCGSHGRGPRFDPLCAHHFIRLFEPSTGFPTQASHTVGDFRAGLLAFTFLRDIPCECGLATASNAAPEVHTALLLS